MAVGNFIDITNAIRSVSYIAATHHWYAAIGVIIGLVVALRLYCRYSLGTCHCATDLTGSTVVITGGSTGIGKSTATELARRNAAVIIGARNKERGTQAVNDIKEETGNQKVSFRHLDLCSFDSVRKFAKSIKSTEKNLHILINNAGLIATENKRVMTEDGCEYTMQANHFGHFLLTHLLIDLLKESTPSRIINVSSTAYKMGTLNLDNLDFKEKFTAFKAYSASKLANIFFTTELSKRLNGTGVTVNALHPGAVRSDILKGSSTLFSLITKVLLSLFGKSNLEGAQTTLHLALYPKLNHVSGRFFSDCREKELGKHARDHVTAVKFWKTSEDVVGIKTNN